MSKVKINANYPENPGLVEGKYWLFYDRGFDFMDDPNMFPTKAQLQFDPSTIGLGEMEDIATKQRAARDQYLRLSNELSWTHLYKGRLTGDAYPKAFSKISLDFTKLGAAEHEMTRFVFPSIEDGSNNFPDIVIEGSEMYSWNNPSMPRKGIKILKKRGEWSMEYLVNAMDFQSGGDAGSVNYNLPEEFALSNPFAEYGWYANSTMNQWMSNLFGEDGTGSTVNYGDIVTFRRAVLDQMHRDADSIYSLLSWYGPVKVLDGTAAADYGVSQEEFENTYYNQERYSVVKAWFESYSLPEVNMYRCTLNGVPNQGVKNAFMSSYLKNVFQQFDILGDATTPFEVFGELNLDYIPAVKYVDELKGISGQIGDLVFVEEIGQHMAFDGETFTEARAAAYDDSGMTSSRAVVDAKDKALNELLLSLKPYVWSSHHVPAYAIMENNEIRTESDRTVLNFSTFNV